jgi:hypothetical protein
VLAATQRPVAELAFSQPQAVTDVILDAVATVG